MIVISGYILDLMMKYRIISIIREKHIVGYRIQLSAMFQWLDACSCTIEQT